MFYSFYHYLQNLPKGFRAHTFHSKQKPNNTAFGYSCSTSSASNNKASIIGYIHHKKNPMHLMSPTPSAHGKTVVFSSQSLHPTCRHTTVVSLQSSAMGLSSSVVKASYSTPVHYPTTSFQGKHKSWITSSVIKSKRFATDTRT